MAIEDSTRQLPTDQLQNREPTTADAAVPVRKIKPRWRGREHGPDHRAPAPATFFSGWSPSSQATPGQDLLREEVAELRGQVKALTGVMHTGITGTPVSTAEVGQRKAHGRQGAVTPADPQTPPDGATQPSTDDTAGGAEGEQQGTGGEQPGGGQQTGGTK